LTGEQLKAFESGMPLDGVCATGKALLELGAFAFGGVDCIGLYNGHGVLYLGGVVLIGAKYPVLLTVDQRGFQLTSQPAWDRFIPYVVFRDSLLAHPNR
jgi:hypothetical protein